MFYSKKVTKEMDLFTTFGLVVTLTFNLLTSKSNHFIFIHKCTKVVNLVKFTPAQ